jgi:tetratricopeptide (TPR) repeat protein
MGKKNKKGNKGQKDIHQMLQQISAEQCFEQGKAFLEKGKARDAIDALKLAEKKNGDSASIRLLLYRAYLLRQDQLRSKGLIPEADAIKQLAIGLMPAPDQLAESDVLGYVSGASVAESLKLYINFSKNHSPSARMDQHLAYRLMMTDDWEPLDVLELSHPLRRDSSPAKEAVSLMNQGNWEDALQVLKMVPRGSPYAPIRLFCRAMVLFYQENDSEMLHTLSRIPEDFPFSRCIESLKYDVDRKNANISDPDLKSCLWEGSADPEKMVREILTCLKNSQIKQAALQISGFAKTLFPYDPVFATQQLLEAVVFSSQFKDYDLDDLQKMVRSVLPLHQAALVITKADMDDSPDPRQSMKKYLSLLEKEIPDLTYRNMVTGMVLVYVAHVLHSENPGHHSTKDMFGVFDKLMGLSRNGDDMDKIVLDIVVQSIELDPLNRKAYELLINLPRDSRPAKDAIERALLKMSVEFKDDPFPCLELATLYYENNAFRKAERVLGKAMERAPHDNRVLDRRALSLVISACKNLHRGKLHLVLPDLEKAEGFNSKKITPLIAEKRALLDLVANSEHAENFILKNFPAMNSPDRIRALGLLVQDAHAYGKPITSNHVKKLKHRLIQEIKQITPSSSDMITLLSPYPKEFKPVLPKQHIAHILLSNRSNLLDVIPDVDLIPTFELLFHKDILGFMAGELQKRLRNINRTQALPMLFFLITLRYMTGHSYCSERYKDVMAMADDSMKKELETLSKKLSRHASGYLKSSLEHFNFSALEDPFPIDDFLGSPFQDFDEDDFDEMDNPDKADNVLDMLKDVMPFLDEIGQGIDKEEILGLVKQVEDLVDELDIRGLPEGEIREIRNHIRSVPPMKKMLESMGEMMKFADSSDLSREARILLFGNNPKRKQLSLF